MKGASRLDGRFAPDRQPRTSVRNTNAETFPRRGLPSDETRQRRAASVDFGEVSRVLMADAAFSSQVLRVAEAERKLCDADYCHVGDSLAMSWNFSPELGDVIAHHHDQVTSETPRMRLLVQAACTAASMSGFHAAGPEQEWDPVRLELLLPQGSGLRQPCGDLMEKGASKLNRIECSLL